jgi:hypothetical protein
MLILNPHKLHSVYISIHLQLDFLILDYIHSHFLLSIPDSMTRGQTPRKKIENGNRHIRKLLVNRDIIPAACFRAFPRPSKLLEPLIQE